MTDKHTLTPTQSTKSSLLSVFFSLPASVSLIFFLPYWSAYFLFLPSSLLLLNSLPVLFVCLFAELCNLMPLWLVGHHLYEVTMVAATVRTASTRTHHYAISFLLRVCLSIPLSSLLLFFCSSVSTFLVILLPFLQLSLFLATFSLSFLPLCPSFTCSQGVTLHWPPLLGLPCDWPLCYFGSSE